MTKRSKAIPKHNPAKITLAPAPWDQGADGPANREGLIDQERGETDLATGKVINPNKVFGKVRMPLFRRYAKQGRITADHAETAHRIYAAYAGHPNRDPLAAITDRVDGGGTEDPNVTLMDTRRAFYAIWGRIPPRYRPVVEHVVLNDMPIGAMSGGTKPEVAASLFGQLTAGLEAAA
jgi:hypothetical protein